MNLRKALTFLSIAFTLALLGAFIPATSALAAPAFGTVSPGSGPPGTTVSVTVSGFVTSTSVQLYFDGNPIGGAVAVVSGAISTSFQVPSTATPGIASIYAVGNSLTETAVYSTFAVSGGLILGISGGYVGDSVGVTGSGFATGATVPILWDSTTTLTSAIANSSGAISTTITIPAAKRGSHTVSTSLISGSVNFTVGSKLFLSPQTGGSGDSVAVTGTGFGNSTPVTLSGMSFSSITTSTNEQGGFNTAFVVPGTAARGSYTITATDSGGSASALFAVGQTITIALPSGQTKVSPGDVITISGTNFSTGEVIFKLDGNLLSNVSATANASGIFSGATFTVPNLPARTTQYKITAVGSDQAQADKFFSVTPKISVTPVSGTVGSQVTVSGVGFANNSTVTISIPGTSFSNITVGTDINGTITGNSSFAIPASAKGVRSINSIDLSSNSASTTFTVEPKLTLAPTSGIVGDPVTVTGSGFAAGSSITLVIQSGTTESALTVTPADTTASSSGAFSATFAIPPLAGGNWNVRAKTGATVEASAILAVKSNITISKSTGAVGTSVTVSGSGFANTPNVSVTYDGVEKGTSAVLADGSLATPVTFTIPASTKGVHTIRGVQGTSQPSATFTVTTSMALDKTSAVYDDIITVAGNGFVADSNIILGFQSGSTEYALIVTPADITVSSSGAFSATFFVPLVPSGNWTVKAYTASAIEASATLAVKSKITLTPATGASGTQVTVAGYGFGKTRPISMKYNNVALAISTTNSDANGYFNVSFNAPASSAGTFSVEAADGINSAKADFVLVTSASISVVTNENSPGYVGMELTFSGTGFKASTPVIITFESTPVQVASVTSAADGSFKATFKVPAATKGAHIIKATDGTTTKEFPFYMEGTAPAKPSLVAPVDKFKPKQPVSFSWYGVIDPSGVTYEFQLSLDQTFKTVLLNKTGLSVNTYTLSAADSITVNAKSYVEGKLPSSGSKTPYNWRVRAVDGAGNAGEWSTINTFSIGINLPGWMIHVWYGLGIVVALILGLWAGRRMAYQSY